jgi:regulator of extracellular matrix RemA (YlzA/DUF370 family)
MSSEIILNAWKQYGKEIIYSELIKRLSFGNMFNQFESEVLYAIVRDQKPTNILEMGCFNGFTSQIIIDAMKANNNPSRLISSDLLETSKFIDYHDGTTSRTLIIGDSKATIDSSIGDIDFLFIDSDHTYDFAKWYCSVIIPMVKRGCFVMVHDWEGIEGDSDGEFKSIIENAVNIGTLKRCINLMEYVKKNRHLSSTPNNIGYAIGDRSPSEILVRI